METLDTDYDEYMQYEQEYEDDMRVILNVETTEYPLPLDTPIKQDLLGGIMEWYAIAGRAFMDFDPEDIWNKSLRGWDNLLGYEKDGVRNVYKGFNVAEEVQNCRDRLRDKYNARKRHRK